MNNHSIISNVLPFADDYLPAHLIARQAQIEKLRAALVPLTRKRPIKHLWIHGPPGTGKTRMALKLLGHKYASLGVSRQFHPNTTYESFVGGLAPTATKEELGFRFEPAKGALMKAAAEAEKVKPQPYLFHIDEINRADLSKVLGEAIFLLEYSDEKPRAVTLPYDFGPPWQNRLVIPSNFTSLAR